jgi:Ger(x)C family germination protein
MRGRKTKEVLYFLLIIILGFLIMTRPNIQPAEQMDVEIALGADLKEIADNIYEYIITRCVYVFGEEKKLSSRVIVSKGTSFGIARENRMQYSDKPSISGVEKIYVLNENYAAHGIRTSIDISFINPHVNDTGILVISKDKSEDIMKYNIPIYASSSDFVEGLIKNNKGMNFFPDEFDNMDIYVTLDSEGRNVVLPYIEIDKDGIRLSGEAVFKGDKMVKKVDMENSRIMNMLRYNNVEGMLTIQKNGKEYIDFYAKSKRKIKCFKTHGKYNFIIDLKLEGEMVSNTTNNKISANSSFVKEFENIMAEQVRSQCNDFIGIMKNEIKVDCLELGRVAAAKFGRRKGNDWNEIISNSPIEVNAEVKLNRYGRGDF